jgi:hypothetical protein
MILNRNQIALFQNDLKSKSNQIVLQNDNFVLSFKYVYQLVL